MKIYWEKKTRERGACKLNKLFWYLRLVCVHVPKTYAFISFSAVGVSLENENVIKRTEVFRWNKKYTQAKIYNEEWNYPKRAGLQREFDAFWLVLRLLVLLLNDNSMNFVRIYSLGMKKNNSITNLWYFIWANSIVQASFRLIGLKKKTDNHHSSPKSNIFWVNIFDLLLWKIFYDKLRFAASADLYAYQKHCIDVLKIFIVNAINILYGVVVQ